MASKIPKHLLALFRDASRGGDVWVTKQYDKFSKGPPSQAALKKLMGEGFDAGRRWAQTALGESGRIPPGVRKYWVDFTLRTYSQPTQKLYESWQAGMSSVAGKYLKPEYFPHADKRTAAKKSTTKKRASKKRTAKKRTSKR